MLVGDATTFTVTPTSAFLYMNSFQAPMDGYYSLCSLAYFEALGDSVTVYLRPNTKSDWSKWNITFRLMKVT